MASPTGISSWCNQSPLLRRKRDAVVSNQQCVQVQWRFLQHQNPAPPRFSSGNTKPASSRNTIPAQLSQTCSDRVERDARTRTQRRSPSNLFDLFANPQVEAEISEEHKRQHESQLRQQQKREQQQCRVLNDILGETQRKAMLNRIMAEMETLALQTGHHKPKSQRKRRGEPSDIDENTEHHRVDESKLTPVFRKPSGGIQALRDNLAPPTTLTPSDRNSISLLPQRRISALGAICLEELAVDGDHQGSEDDEDDDDDEDDYDQDEDAEDGVQRRTAESIAVAEIRKLRKHHQRKQRWLEAQGQSSQRSGSTAGKHIFWQKSSRVKVAIDIPQSLQIPVQLVCASDSHSPVHQPTPCASSIISMSPNAPSHPNIGGTPPTTFMDEQQSFNNLVTRRRRPFLVRTDSTQSIMSGNSKSFHRGHSTCTTSSCTPDEPGVSMPATDSPPKSPLSPVVASPRDARKLQAPYGAWYLPRRQWWELHQKERQALVERFPEEAEALTLAQKGQHDHCHHGGAQVRNHMPPVVAQAPASLATAEVLESQANVASASRMSVSVSNARAASDVL